MIGADQAVYAVVKNKKVENLLVFPSSMTYETVSNIIHNVYDNHYSIKNVSDGYNVAFLSERKKVYRIGENLPS